MLSKIHFILVFLIILMLTSCAVVDEKQSDSKKMIEAEGHTAWFLSDYEKRVASSNRAVGLLLAQADDLMAVSNFEQAGDKLERLVRIEPKFAQAWSRLAWMALKSGDAKRSRQLARRSNSYARDNTNLQLLNWHFIQQAGEQLNDAEIIQQAQQMIKKLGDD